MRAEEKAARLPAIMTVPLILFILPVLFVVINNGEYRILKQYGANAYAAGRVPFVGLDLDDPAIDFLALAASMGVPARRASTEAQAAEAVHAALASGRPALLELAVRP